MGNISAFIMYSRSTVGISHHKKDDLAYKLRLWKGIDLEVFGMVLRNRDFRIKKLGRNFE
jgi:hypothetical protein